MNLLARLEPATIWSDGLFMEPGGGGPGPDLANLEAISSPGAGSVWSSHQRVGTTPSSPHTPHHPEPRPLWGSLRSPVSCRALQFGPAPRPRALKTRRHWATHRPGHGGGRGWWGAPGPSWKEPRAELLSGMFGFEYTCKRTEETHTRNSAQRVQKHGVKRQGGSPLPASPHSLHKSSVHSVSDLLRGCECPRTQSSCSCLFLQLAAHFTFGPASSPLD